ncbi:lactoylglutathione lyase [Francisella sp. SYW-9]|uniref:lactoylglutathione lyase n=1 Tax=Francisella sp. SYW-9 TaxID=2610888 RepID=UPI00123D8BCB|nr:lactoylglutathione lyase [Francisella sp. SYW-9]
MFTISDEKKYTKITVEGKLTHADYTKVLIPKLDELAKNGAVKILIKMQDFSGIGLRAIFDEFKTEIKHRKHFEKVAFVTSSSKVSTSIKIFRHFFSGEIQTFTDENWAKNWLVNTRMRYLHTMIRIKDLDKSLDFYCNKLGLKEVSRQDNKQGKFTLIFLAAHDDYDIAKTDKSPLIELTYNWDSDETYEGGRNFGHLAFSVENIYDICQSLKDQGVIINRPPRDGHMAFIKSPDGISIELIQEGKPLAKQEPWASMENIGTW